MRATSMRWLSLVLAILPAAAAAAAARPSLPPPPRNDGSSWPTLHGDLTRSGFYPRMPRGPLKLVWRKELYRELTGPRCEVIVGDGLAFMGTYAGNLYAWDAQTGDERWVFRAGGPIGHSPMLAGGTVYVGSMDRRLYAVSAADGKPRWSFRAAEGIWASPAVLRGQVLVGDRGGTFYAVRAHNGALAWEYPAGGPILTSAAVSADGNAVFFAAEDMHLYCLNPGLGFLNWRSHKLAGLSVRDYFPVVAGDTVMITTNPVRDFHWTLTTHERMLVERTGFQGADPRFITAEPGDATAKPAAGEIHQGEPGSAPAEPGVVEKEQDAIIAYLKSRPEERTFYAFRTKDGHEPWIAPILYTGGMHNPPAPPCYDPQTGDVYVILRTAYGTWDGGSEVRSYTGLGRLDLATGRVALLEHAYPSREPGRAPGARDMPWMHFNLIGDETQALACAPGLLLSNHQGVLGALDLRTRLCQALFGKRDTYAGFYGPGTFGWEEEAGAEKARLAGRPRGLVNEWHGPARAIAAVAGEYVYLNVGSQVICLKGEAP